MVKQNVLYTYNYCSIIRNKILIYIAQWEILRDVKEARHKSPHTYDSIFIKYPKQTNHSDIRSRLVAKRNK